tara:strand:+ start:107 stop:946 length:840 start_codon:yes stop_codon:yes gene_type:complete
MAAPLLAGMLLKGAPLAAGALKYLPVIGAVGGAMPGLKKGNIGEAALGAGLGALTGGTSGGLIKAGGAGAARLAGQKGLQQALKKGAQNIGAKGLAKELTGKAGQATLGKLAGDVVAPLAGAGAVFGLSQAGGDMGIPPAGGALRGAAGLAGYGSTRGENMAVGGTPLPPGMGSYGGVSPIGDPLSVVSPLGLDAGRRLRTVKDAEALRDAQNILLPTVRKYAEQAKRDEFARNMAATGIKTNIALNAQLASAMQAAGLQMGTTAAQQAGEAITRPYQY